MLGVQHRSRGLKPGRVVQTHATKCARTACECLTHMCGPEQAVNVQLLAGEGNGKPPLLTSFPRPDVGSRKTENTADLSSDRALIIIIIYLYRYILYILLYHYDDDYIYLYIYIYIDIYMCVCVCVC